MKKIIIIFAVISLAFSQLNFSLEDINSTSPTYGLEIGPDSFPGILTLYYFGHQN